MIESPEVDQLALGLVAAVHRDDNKGASLLLHELEWDDLMALSIILAAALERAWLELCDHEGVDFVEFIQESGVWLAEVETP